MLRFREVEALNLEREFPFLQFKVVLPALVIAFHFLTVSEIAEGARKSSRGGCAVAVEKLHLVEVGGGPGAGIREAQMEVEFEIVGGSLATEEDPLIVNGLRDAAGGLLAARAMFGEGVV